MDEKTKEAVQHLTNICHSASVNAGWWQDSDTTNPLLFPLKLFLAVSECVEAMEGDRSNKMDDKLPHRPMREVEVADALIRLFDLAGQYNLDVAGALVEKMAYNKTREDHKPENRAKIGGKRY